MLDLPIVAGEEQTGDNFASILAIASRRPVVPLSAAALNEARFQRKGAPTLHDFADDHGFDRQRAFDNECLVYGSAPQRFSDLIAKGFLPAARARICPFDYQREILQAGDPSLGALRCFDNGAVLGSALLPAGVQECSLQLYSDERGSLVEIFREEWELPLEPVQWNAVRSEPGTLRGVTFKKAGKYAYLCTVGSHAAMGMKGVFVVR